MLTSLAWAMAPAGLRPHERLDDRAMAYALSLVRERPGVVIDVGANNGKQSMMAVLAKRRVYAVECLSSAYEELLEIFRNMSTETIAIVHACGGQDMQLSTLHLADDSSSLVKHNVLLGRELEKHREVGRREGRTTETALVIPLDSLFHAETVALVKVDTQGSEDNVLRGMQKTLNQRPVIMYEETSRFTNTAGSAAKGVMALLRPLGYVCKSFCERWCSKARDRVCKSS